MTRCFVRFALLTMALLVLPVTAFSQVTKTKDGYLLRMKWKAGDVYEYAMSSDTEMTPGTPFNFKMEYSMTVLDVKNKIANVEMNMSNPMTNEPTKMEVKMNDRGMADKEAAAAMGMGNSQFGLQLPEKPLKEGESWKAEQPMMTQGMEMDMQTTYTFVGLEIVNKVPCAKIIVKTHVEMKGEMAMTVKGDGVIYIENKTGQLYSSSISSTTEIDMNGNAMKVPSKTEIKRK